ncbi:MAG: hypothetical protein WB554_12050 [Desulfomonilaceae bacterium]
MPKKPVKIESGKLFNGGRYITAKELMEALDRLKASILMEQKQQMLSPPMEDAPRPRIFHKKKEGKREKLASTVDSELFELVKSRQQQGQQLSHILDSALWNYFGRPKLSFQDESEESKN